LALLLVSLLSFRSNEYGWYLRIGGGGGIFLLGLDDTVVILIEELDAGDGALSQPPPKLNQTTTK
jgi:hypothetical protein